MNDFLMGSLAILILAALVYRIAYFFWKNNQGTSS